MSSFEGRRERMVEDQLVARGIADSRVLAAFRTVERERFVPSELANRAYEDSPLAIGFGQTISQPFVVALTVQALGLQGTERILEIGTGSGYEAAILAALGADVFTVERLEPLATKAAELLVALDVSNVWVRFGDGSLGWPEKAPFDAIAVSAAGPFVPPALLTQLRDGGRLVMPVGPDRTSQVLQRITRDGREFDKEPLESVRFVPLIGEQAWQRS